MALSHAMTELLLPYVKAGMRVAAMGYPDIIAMPALIERALGAKMEELKYRADSAEISRRHLLQAPRQIPDAASFFALMGCELDVYDVVPERGGEILCDLNRPMFMRHSGHYDIVLDVGTLEHCFNIAQAAFNMAGLVNEGGYIFHENPFNWANHGFYGLNPTWYADFYGENGFTLLACHMQERTQQMHRDIERTNRFIYQAGETNLLAIARRDKVQEMRYPVQTRYKALIKQAA